MRKFLKRIKKLFASMADDFELAIVDDKLAAPGREPD
jgi:hypothetical protein